MQRRKPSRKPPHGGARRAEKSAETLELRIESIAAGGEGVAHHDGRAVFVPRTAPSDLIEAAVAPAGAVLRGRLLRVIEQGPLRVEPPCPFFEACGGCDLMFLSADGQREAHKSIVEDALRRIAGIGELPEFVAHEIKRDDGAPLKLGYRTRARFYARAVAKGPKTGRVEVGYRAPGSHDLASVEHCMVLVPELDALLSELSTVLEGAKGSGEISVALGARRLPVVDVYWRGDLPVTLWAHLDRRIAEGLWAGARACLDGASKPAVFGDPRPVFEGADGRSLVVAAGGFAQPSDEAAILLARRTADLVRKSGDEIASIVELFAGSGTLSILLSPLAHKLMAIESQEEASRAARENLDARGLSAKVVCADAETFDFGRPNVVVLDPPRTGARGAMDRIVASHAKAVVYVACDPVTMARDIGILVGAGYALTDVETVEIFPQTSHVETIVRLERKGGGKR